MSYLGNYRISDQEKSSSLNDYHFREFSKEREKSAARGEYQKNKLNLQMDEDMEGYMEWLTTAEDMDPINYKKDVEEDTGGKKVSVTDEEASGASFRKFNRKLRRRCRKACKHQVMFWVRMLSRFLFVRYYE